MGFASNALLYALVAQVIVAAAQNQDVFQFIDPLIGTANGGKICHVSICSMEATC